MPSVASRRDSCRGARPSTAVHRQAHGKRSVPDHCVCVRATDRDGGTTRVHPWRLAFIGRAPCRVGSMVAGSGAPACTVCGRGMHGPPPPGFMSQAAIGSSKHEGSSSWSVWDSDVRRFSFCRRSGNGSNNLGGPAVEAEQTTQTNRTWSSADVAKLVASKQILCGCFSENKHTERIMRMMWVCAKDRGRGRCFCMMVRLCAFARRWSDPFRVEVSWATYTNDEKFPPLASKLQPHKNAAARTVSVCTRIITQEIVAIGHRLRCRRRRPVLQSADVFVRFVLVPPALAREKKFRCTQHPCIRSFDVPPTSFRRMQSVNHG
jgi:hypothetical protein